LAYYPENITYAKDIKVRWDDLPEGQGPTGKAVRSGKPEITTDITSDAEFIQWKNIASKYEFRSTAVFPLIARGKVLGALNLYSKKRAFFDMEKNEHMMTFARVAAIFLENIRLFEYTQKRLEEMTALRNIDIAISGSIDLRVVCNVALDEIINYLKVDAASVFIINLGGMSRIFYAGRGFRTKVIETSPQKGLMISRILRERKIIHIPDLRKTDKSTFGRQELIAEEEFVSYYGVPLIAKGNILGVLEIYYRSHFEGNKEWLNYLEILSGQIAISLDNAAIVEDLKNKHFELLKAYDETIEGWGNALSLKEEETEEHSQRVTDMTLRIAEKMGIKGEELVSIKRGALLHDIGKIGIPDVILLKPGKLTDEEWEIVKKHPDYAFMMLSPISYLSKAVEIPYCHHERWDGKGYPRGLKGKQIPLSARIFAVVDVWDALSYDRPYRKAWPKDKVIEYIKKESGKQFDPEVVLCFLEVLVEINSEKGNKNK
jgi:HD-GYP domain-containing protein (c-di-GMP phosphodiesterase class II)